MSSFANELFISKDERRCIHSGCTTSVFLMRSIYYFAFIKTHIHRCWLVDLSYQKEHPIEIVSKRKQFLKRIVNFRKQRPYNQSFNHVNIHRTLLCTCMCVIFFRTMFDKNIFNVLRFCCFSGIHSFFYVQQFRIIFQ